LETKIRCEKDRDVRSEKQEVYEVEKHDFIDDANASLLVQRESKTKSIGFVLESHMTVSQIVSVFFFI
jgi:hypothetical protein